MQPISSKVLSAYYQSIIVGNVFIIMVKGEAVAFGAPGFGRLTSFSNRSATLCVRAYASFGWQPRAAMTGGTPYNACLTNALKNAFKEKENATIENTIWFDQYKDKYQQEHKRPLDYTVF